MMSTANVLDLLLRFLGFLTPAFVALFYTRLAAGDLAVAVYGASTVAAVAVTRRGRYMSLAVWVPTVAAGIASLPLRNTFEVLQIVYVSGIVGLVATGAWHGPLISGWPQTIVRLVRAVIGLGLAVVGLYLPLQRSEPAVSEGGGIMTTPTSFLLITYTVIMGLVGFDLVVAWYARIRLDRPRSH